MSEPADRSCKREVESEEAEDDEEEDKEEGFCIVVISSTLLYACKGSACVWISSTLL